MEYLSDALEDAPIDSRILFRAHILCELALTYPQFLVLKTLQGCGFGGERAAGAVLMAETIRNEHRGKAMGNVQSAWAVGCGAAVLPYALMFSLLPGDTAWRVMFGTGVVWADAAGSFTPRRTHRICSGGTCRA